MPVPDLSIPVPDFSIPEPDRSIPVPDFSTPSRHRAMPVPLLSMIQRDIAILLILQVVADRVQVLLLSAASQAATHQPGRRLSNYIPLLITLLPLQAHGHSTGTNRFLRSSVQRASWAPRILREALPLL